jgi:hypothetical protein
MRISTFAAPYYSSRSCGYIGPIADIAQRVRTARRVPVDCCGRDRPWPTRRPLVMAITALGDCSCPGRTLLAQFWPRPAPQRCSGTLISSALSLVGHVTEARATLGEFRKSNPSASIGERSHHLRRYKTPLQELIDPHFAQRLYMKRQR